LNGPFKLSTYLFSSTFFVVTTMIIPLNEKLRELRDALNLSLEEVAKVAGVTKTTISNWEAGKGEPGHSQLQKLAKYYRVRAAYFFDEVDELIEKEPKAVLVYESLLAFLAQRGIMAERHPYFKAVDVPERAPKTVDAWADYDRVTTRIFGDVHKGLRG
jgi:transcriptional regulator with XRE-family HTH domain